MAGGITDTGAGYSRLIGLIYIFNLIVGTGALTMPSAFASAGWLLSLIIVIALAIVSNMTVSFVTEAMGWANAKLRYDAGQAHMPPVNVSRVVDGEDADESRPLLQNGTCDHSTNPCDMTERTELGQMAKMFFNKWGLLAFYLCMVLYLYGDLAIYAAAVPVSLRDVICTYKLPNVTEACNHSLKLTDSDNCWEGRDIDRGQAYRICLTIFFVTGGPFVFFNIQKTKYLQLFTTVMRWLSFGTMVVLAVIRLSKGQGQGHPEAADFSGIPNLFGVCVYSFMCHHSLPSLVTPINNKKGLFRLIGLDFLLILGFYALISFTGIFAFNKLNDLYTLNFLPDPCDSSEPITNVAVIQYFLALFPVFTLSTNFPIISITLRNNLKTMFYKGDSNPFPWVVDRIVFPLGAIIPPFIIAFCTSQVEFLVGVTGSYAGAGIQYVIPAALVYFARKDMNRRAPNLQNPYTSPFKHRAWVWFAYTWATVCMVIVSVNHIITGK
ncbi:transmembrane protein 104-like [Mizuhopecten yessoensis]|uniref:Transmembrane protein 104 n=1 Tax=Mizuhopecten yessoensis TaxID=6573 RepID=A0A210QQB1_MIZYE|nr:transmembrane protein 104-like [Mizuhopecten yessoensis]OWF50888.1 Transmembrane protein 104 [Mizuhopecten yessoensis]